MFGLNDPLFTTGYQNDPQFSGLFYPNDPTFIALGTEWPGFYSGCFTEWPPYFGEYTFYLIGPYFWLGVGTYLSLQIGSAPPRDKMSTNCNVLP